MATNNINLAGEFYAMHRLFREGYEPALTLGNTKGVDILLYNPKNGKQFKVEVKTSGSTATEKLFGGKNIKWWMHRKHETIVDSQLVYCFVYIAPEATEMPRVFFMPSKEVAKQVKQRHQSWVERPHKNPIKITDIRAFRIPFDKECKWENNFSLFEKLK